MSQREREENGSPKIFGTPGGLERGEAADSEEKVSDRSAPDSRRLVLWFAGVPWDSPRGTDQQLALAISRIADVLYVDPPLSVARTRRLRTEPPRTLFPGLSRLTPLAPPGPHRRGIRRATRWFLRLQARRGLGRRHPDVIICTSLDDVLGTVPHALRVFVGTDDYVAGAKLMGQTTEALLADERRQLARADIVTAVSSTLAHRWEELGHRHVTVLPNGCDVSGLHGVATAIPTAALTLAKPVIGLVGNISERIDIALLEAIADAGLSLLLVGPRRASFAPGRFERLVARPEVRWLGPQPYGDLPPLLAAMDVGITPYADDEFNRASFPLKTLEYLAAGLPVVSTPLPAVETLGTPHVQVAAGPHDFVAAVRIASTRSADPTLREARRQFAMNHSWEARANEFWALMLPDLP